MFLLKFIIICYYCPLNIKKYNIALKKILAIKGQIFSYVILCIVIHVMDLIIYHVPN